MQAARLSTPHALPQGEPRLPKKVADVMNVAVAALRPGDPLVEAIRILRKNRISGCPVTGERGQVVGVLSERDVVRALNASWLESRPLGLLELILPDSSWDRPEILQDLKHRLARLRVSQAMTVDPATVDVDAPLDEAAHIMRLRCVNRLPVTRHGHLVGILTRRDMIAAWPH